MEAVRLEVLIDGPLKLALDLPLDQREAEALVVGARHGRAVVFLPSDADPPILDRPSSLTETSSSFEDFSSSSAVSYSSTVDCSRSRILRSSISSTSAACGAVASASLARGPERAEEHEEQELAALARPERLDRHLDPFGRLALGGQQRAAPLGRAALEHQRQAWPPAVESAALEDALLLVHRRKEVAVRTDAFRGAEEQVAARPQRVVEGRDHLLLQFGNRAKTSGTAPEAAVPAAAVAMTWEVEAVDRETVDLEALRPYLSERVILSAARKHLETRGPHTLCGVIYRQVAKI
ncbi:hypothetical protein [Cereibacter azotoformans]|uniref:hypothetical protein n=1 Tax=Cereibacter azotoformans TaxID=43057 RepID=UPI003B8A8B53